MKIAGIIWLDEVIYKLFRKHSVHQKEVKEVLNNNPHVRFVEKGHRTGENVYSAMGKTDAGRYLILFFVYKKTQHALILSAREMTKNERKRYAKK